MGYQPGNNFLQKDVLQRQETLHCRFSACQNVNQAIDVHRRVLKVSIRCLFQIPLILNLGKRHPSHFKICKRGNGADSFLGYVLRRLPKPLVYNPQSFCPVHEAFVRYSLSDLKIIV